MKGPYYSWKWLQTRIWNSIARSYRSAVSLLLVSSEIRWYMRPSMIYLSRLLGTVRKNANISWWRLCMSLVISRKLTENSELPKFVSLSEGRDPPTFFSIEYFPSNPLKDKSDVMENGGAVSSLIIMGNIDLTFLVHQRSTTPEQANPKDPKLSRPIHKDSFSKRKPFLQSHGRPFEPRGENCTRRAFAHFRASE